MVSVIIEDLKTLYFNFSDKLEFKVRVKTSQEKSLFLCHSILLSAFCFFLFFFDLAYGIPPRGDEGCGYVFLP